MNFIDKYKYWIKNEYFDKETKAELIKIKDNEAEIEDRFYKDLEFGTGGLRGKIGAGTNRINKYTVAKATQGLADFIIENEESKAKNEEQESSNKKLSVVIAYDSRHKSDEFAKQAALVLAANGIKAYLFESLRPTPELSFAVRHIGANAGIVLTASHNPPEYNGYKAYWSDGGQLVPEIAHKVIDKVNAINEFSSIKTMDENEALGKGLLKIIGKEIDEIYIEKVKSLSIRDDVDKNIKIVYTPLHGTGNIPVRRVLNELGYSNVHVVKEQELPDPQFSTVGYPNPEDPKAFELAIKMGNQIGADILLGTDPDCDRVGVVVKDNNNKYIVLNGNQTGALLLDYILCSRKDKGILPDNGIIVKTIVTSEIGRVIAKHYGLETIDTLTGFKYIGEKIKQFEENGDYSFQFGYEESFGYLTGTFARDKDAVVASMVICEMTGYYKKKGLNLYQALMNLYDRFGFYVEELYSVNLEGIEGKKKIDMIMDSFRRDYPAEIDNTRVCMVNDYKTGKSYDCKLGTSTHISLPSENVMKYILDDDSWYALRPSGTEPKLKIYISANGNDCYDANAKLKAIEKEVMKRIR